MPYEEHEQQSGDQKNQAVSQHLVLRFKVWIDGTQQADSPTPVSQEIVVIASPSASSVSIFAILVLTIPRLRRKGSRNQLREWVDDVPNYHKSQRDQPIELVEQFQVGSTIQNEALVEKLIRWTFIGFLGPRGPLVLPLVNPPVRTR